MSPTQTQAVPTVAQVHEAVASRDLVRAVRMAQQAYAAGNRESLIMNLVAYQLELDDKLEDALVVLNQALKLTPRDPFLINSIGVCYSKLAKPQNALMAFEDALALHPNFAQAHYGRGLALQSLGDKEGARLSQLRAAELEPEFAEPLGALAASSAEEKQWEEARSFAERSLKLDPAQPAACLAMAAVELNDGDAAASVARIDKLLAGERLTRLHLANALNLKGDALEALGRAPEAMECYIGANRETRPLQVAALNARELGLAMAERLIGYFETADAADWTPIPESERLGGEREHVFLVGFARSGTTLLEQILASHGDFVALEEKATVDPAVLEFMVDKPSLDRLAKLDEAGAREWREMYWNRVREFDIDPTGKVFVDKLPLHTLYLPVIAKLFPRAKILFARRDPRDVVISCFKHRFKANPLTVEFTDLEQTAKVYSAAMRLAEIYREKLTLPVHLHQHEHLVEDLDGSTQAICDFIGVPWDANMRNFVETANKRNIRTPSAPQVRKGLNRSGVAAWRKYGNTIDPIMPILQPWAVKFGYDAE